MAATKVGHTLAKVLGIKLPYRNPTGEDITRGESVYSVSSADTYVEQEPTAMEWIREVTPNGRKLGSLGLSSLPIHPLDYSLQRSMALWRLGRRFRFLHARAQDSTKYSVGITVGCVVVPQSMAYAKLAELDPQFGLYSSFMGVLIYWFFATSKDITIGVSPA